jgi:hypothetical protein
MKNTFCSLRQKPVGQSDGQALKAALADPAEILRCE